MLETKKINDDPIIIQHKVYSFTNPKETINDIKWRLMLLTNL